MSALNYSALSKTYEILHQNEHEQLNNWVKIRQSCPAATEQAWEYGKLEENHGNRCRMSCPGHSLATGTFGSWIHYFRSRLIHKQSRSARNAMPERVTKQRSVEWSEERKKNKHIVKLGEEEHEENGEKWKHRCSDLEQVADTCDDCWELLIPSLVLLDVLVQDFEEPVELLAVVWIPNPVFFVVPQLLLIMF